MIVERRTCGHNGASLARGKLPMHPGALRDAKENVSHPGQTKTGLRGEVGSYPFQRVDHQPSGSPHLSVVMPGLRWEEDESCVAVESRKIVIRQPLVDGFFLTPRIYSNTLIGEQVSEVEEREDTGKQLEVGRNKDQPGDPCVQQASDPIAGVDAQ
jgi:hypothetical protein